MELVIMRDSHVIGHLRLSEGTFSIGRGLHNTMALDDHSVSRRHARLKIEPGRITVQDLQSANGSFLRGNPVSEALLQDGDVLEVGPFSLQVNFTEEDFIRHDLLDRTETQVSLDQIAETTPSSPRTSLVTSHAFAPPDPPWIKKEEKSGGGEPSYYILDAEPSPAGSAAPIPRSDRTPITPSHRSMTPNSPTVIPTPSAAQTTARLPATRSAFQLPHRNGAKLDSADGAENLPSTEVGIAADSVRPAPPTPVKPRLPNTFNLAETVIMQLPGRTQTGDIPKANSSSDVSKRTPHLVVRQGQASRSEYDLGQGTAFIGRAEEMEIVLLDANASRRHAVIYWEDNGYHVRDLWSLNGIKVRGEKVSDTRLNSGDWLEIGDTALEFIWHDAPTNQKGTTAQPLNSMNGNRSSTPTAVSGTMALPAARTARAPLVYLLPMTLVGGIVLGFGIPSAIKFWESQQTPTVQPLPPPSLNKQAAIEIQGLLDSGDLDAALIRTTTALVSFPRDEQIHRIAATISERHALGVLEQRIINEAIDPSVAPETTPDSVQVSAAPIRLESGAATIALSPQSAPVNGREKASATVPTTQNVEGISGAGSAASGRSNKMTGTSQARTAPVRTDSGSRMQRSYDQGISASRQGREVEAIQAFERALADDPYKESELYYQIEDEIQALRKSLQEKARPLVTEAQSLMERGEWSVAQKRLKEAISRDPYNAQATSLLSKLDAEMAEKARVIYDRAVAAEQRGGREDAIVLYTQVLEFSPDPSSSLHQKAQKQLRLLTSAGP